SAWNINGNSGTSAATNFIGTTDSQDFVFNTGGPTPAYERMRILSTGNVGIGTNAPITLFHVQQKPIPGAEVIAAFSVLDAPAATNLIAFTNNSAVNNVFEPALSTSNYSSSGPAFSLNTKILNTFDAGSEPIIKFRINTSIGSVLNRPLFALSNGDTLKLTVDNEGNVGIGESIKNDNNHAVVVYLKATGAISKGSIVIVDPNNDNAVVTTNLSGHTSVVGVALDNVNPGAIVRVAVSGVAEVRIGPAGCVRGQHAITSTSFGLASSTPSPGNGTSIGVFLESNSGIGTAKVLLK
ncbi:MAG: hypothetical protein IT440_16430, partial [Phycisphaeraceae bacterium]|nr:hypothetical protein [Phycisphaeraceae bacterium]